MKKVSLVYIMFLLPLFYFSQRNVGDFFNNRIDFVLDNDYGKDFMGVIISKHIRTDSLNHFYSKKNIQPFYNYMESEYFDKKFLKSTSSVMEGFLESEYDGFYEMNTYRGLCEYELKLFPHRKFLIKSTYLQPSRAPMARYSYYEPFENFELMMSKAENKILIDKTLYSNVSFTIDGIDLYDAEYFDNINFFNTLTINYINCRKCKKCKNKNECPSFSVVIYETIGMDGPYLEVDKKTKKTTYYMGSYPNIVMRKVDITGNRKNAIKYLKKNKLDYTEIKPENYEEYFFKKKVNR